MLTNAAKVRCICSGLGRKLDSDVLTEEALMKGVSKESFHSRTKQDMGHLELAMVAIHYYA